MRRHKQRHETRLDRSRIVADPMIARWRARLAFRQRMLQPRQRRLASHRRAVLALCLELARQHRHHRIVPQLVVVDQVLVAEHDAEHALADQRLYPVRDKLWPAAIPEAAGKGVDRLDRLIGGAQQQRAGIRADHPAIERAHNERPCTVPKSNESCLHSVAIGERLRRAKPLHHNKLSLIRSPDGSDSVRKAA
jgi:hypothetical protein